MSSHFRFTARHLIALSILWTGAFSVAVRADSPDEQEYQGTKAVVGEILEKHSPSQSVFVGVGRSPTPFTTMLAVLHPQSVINLPLTGAKRIEGELASSKKLSAEFGVKDRALENLDAHLERHLGPVLAKLGHRRLVFMDYVVNGSFVSALRIFEEYLRRRHPDVKWDYLAITTKTSMLSNRLELPEDKIVWLDGKPDELARRLAIQYYDKVSEFGAWNLSDSEAVPNASHARYSAGVRERMRASANAENELGCQIPLVLESVRPGK